MCFIKHLGTTTEKNVTICWMQSFIHLLKKNPQHTVQPVTGTTAGMIFHLPFRFNTKEPLRKYSRLLVSTSDM